MCKCSYLSQEKEFLKMFHVPVIEIPTNLPNIRKDLPIQAFAVRFESCLLYPCQKIFTSLCILNTSFSYHTWFQTARGKWEHVSGEVESMFMLGRPVLVGTTRYPGISSSYRVISLLTPSLWYKCILSSSVNYVSLCSVIDLALLKFMFMRLATLLVISQCFSSCVWLWSLDTRMQILHVYAEIRQKIKGKSRKKNPENSLIWPFGHLALVCTA